jgi:AcrR family transcriptional regulator
MPRPRFSKLSFERRVAILEAAGREFAVHGYDGASLNHILARAGLSKGAAYYYFDDKADLFTTVVQHCFYDDLVAHAGLDVDRLDAASFWPKVSEVYRQGALHLHENPWMPGVARAVWRLSGEARGQRTLAQLFTLARAWAASLLRKGQQLGVVRTDLPDDLLVALVLGIDEAAEQWLVEHLPALPAAEVEALTMRLLKTARRLIEPQPEDDP